MKGTILFLLMSVSVISVSAQIFATTSSGKKVILNMDGTWKYADDSDSEKPCLRNHTGNLTVTNNTDIDIYFYYSTTGLFNVLVKAGTSKTISNIKCCPVNRDEQMQYYWVASLELVDNPIGIHRVEGIERGTFSITECKTEELEIGN